MNYYSISQLEQLSGIKSHTIRIWEQRYNALTPNRSEGNTRYYDDNQLRRLLNIVSLLEENHKISKLSKLTDAQLFELLEDKIKNSLTANDNNHYYITQLIAAGIGFDEIQFEKLLSDCIQQLGFKNTYVKVVYPMLVQIGLLWQNDTLTPANEHFISNLIRQKLFSAIDSLPLSKKETPCWLLFLPQDENHEIGLLFAHYLIRQAGHKVIYLGCNVPLETLKSVTKSIAPTHLLFYLVHHDIPQTTNDYLTTLIREFDNSKICLAGNEKLIEKLQLDNKIHWIKTVDDLEHELTKKNV